MFWLKLLPISGVPTGGPGPPKIWLGPPNFKKARLIFFDFIIFKESKTKLPRLGKLFDKQRLNLNYFLTENETGIAVGSLASCILRP